MAVTVSPKTTRVAKRNGVPGHLSTWSTRPSTSTTSWPTFQPTRTRPRHLNRGAAAAHHPLLRHRLPSGVATPERDRHVLRRAARSAAGAGRRSPPKCTTRRRSQTNLRRFVGLVRPVPNMVRWCVGGQPVVVSSDGDEWLPSDPPSSAPLPRARAQPARRTKRRRRRQTQPTEVHRSSADEEPPAPVSFLVASAVTNATIRNWSVGCVWSRNEPTNWELVVCMVWVRRVGACPGA